MIKKLLNHINAPQPENWRTTRSERRNYILGEIGRTCEGSIVTAFMTLFLVFQGIELKMVAGVMLIVKIIDAVNDVAFGYLVDRLKITEWKAFKNITGKGKYLPWFRLTFAFFPLFTIGFFMMPSDITMTGKLLWFAAFYILYDFAYTLVEVPMNTMMITLTDQLDERNSIIQYKTVIGGLSVMLVQILWLTLVSEYVGIPLRLVAIVSAVVFFFMMLPIATKVKEHNTVLAGADEEASSHYTFKDMLTCVKTNKYLMVLLLSTFLSTCFATGGAVGTFVSYYHFHSSLILAIPIFIAMIPQMIAQLQTAKLTQKYGKIRVLMTTGLTGAALFTCIYFTGGNFTLAAMFLVLQAIPGNVSIMAKSFLMPDTIEYTRYKTGKDCSGICVALSSFVTKLSTSVASSLGLFILGFSGWIKIEVTDFADLAEQAVVQPQSALDMLWVIFTLVPAIGVILSVAVMAFYRLRDKDIELMAQCNGGEISREECEARLSRKY